MTTEDYLERKRFDVRLVVLNTGLLGIKKQFKGDRLGFLSELEALNKLADPTYAVPRILDL